MGDAVLKQIQAALFPDLGNVLFYWARDRYLAAADLIGAQDRLITTLQMPIAPDTRIVGRLYDRVAKHYRIAHYAGQLTLFSTSDLTLEEQVAEEWCRFFFEEASSLVENNLIAKLLVKSVVGKESELDESLGSLISLLDERYCGRRCVTCEPRFPIRTRDEWIADLVRGRDRGPESRVGELLKATTEEDVDDEEC